MARKKQSSSNYYYIKKGKRFIPAGYLEGADSLPFGVWFVRKIDNSTSHTNILYWKPNEKKIDINKTISEMELCDKVADIIIKFWEKSKNTFNISDLAKEIAIKLLNDSPDKGQ